MTSGTDPSVGVGLLMTVVGSCWIEASVATEEVELDRAGLEGRGVKAIGWEAPAATCVELAFTVAGLDVGIGVLFEDGTLDETGWCGVDTGAV